MPDTKDKLSKIPPRPPDNRTGKDSKSWGPVRQLTGKEMITEAALEVREHISKQPHVQRLFSFMPTLMTRVSPFHFRNKNTFKDWPLVRLDSGDGDTWGKMVIIGELLVIFDETILICLLALMNKYQSDSFEISDTELCKIAGVNPSTNAQNANWKSIQRLAGTRIDLELFKGKGRKKKSIKTMTGSILSYADRNPESGKIRVVLNPYFLEMYGESLVTNIDLGFRTGLKKDISKAFYRFYQGQIDTDHSINIVNLAKAINLDTKEENRRVKMKVKSGLEELKEKGYLDDYDITGDGKVLISKSSDKLISSDNLIRM